MATATTATAIEEVPVEENVDLAVADVGDEELGSEETQISTNEERGNILNGQEIDIDLVADNPSDIGL